MVMVTVRVRVRVKFGLLSLSLSCLCLVFGSCDVLEGQIKGDHPFASQDCKGLWVKG